MLFFSLGGAATVIGFLVVVAESETSLLFEIERGRKFVPKSAGNDLKVFRNVYSDTAGRLCQMELRIPEEAPHHQSRGNARARVETFDNAGVNATLGEVLKSIKDREQTPT